MKTQWSKEWNHLNDKQKSILRNAHKDMVVKLGVIASEFKIKIKVATLDTSISGQIKEDGNGVVIKVNRHDVKARQRYTIAHEISHYLLHRHLLVDGISDDVLYRSSLSNKIEQEANRLAADIIMPPTNIDILLARYSYEFKGESLYELMAEEMGVSKIALKYRLGLS